MIFIALLYSLGGPNLDREAVWMCYTIQAMFCIMCYMCVDNDICLWQHKNAWLLLGVFYWLHVYILIIIIN
jgi:hypothetical protein